MLRRCLIGGLKWTKLNPAIRLAQFHDSNERGGAYKDWGGVSKEWGVASSKDERGVASKDLLQGQLRQSTNVFTLFQLTSQHRNVMNNTHIANAFANLSKIVKETNVYTAEVTENEHFIYLCKDALKKVRFMELNEVLDVLKALSILRISQDSALFQALCQMLRHFLNDLSLNQITYVNFLLFRSNKKNVQTSALIDSLKMALPLVLETQLAYQLDGDNMAELIACLRMATEYSLKATSVERCAKYIWKGKDELNNRQILDLFFALTNYVHMHEDKDSALSKLSNHVAGPGLVDCLHQLNARQISGIIGTLLRDPHLATSKLMTGLSNSVIHTNGPGYNWDMLANLLKLFGIKEFVSTELLDLVADKMKLNPDQVIDDPSVSILTLVDAFSMAEYLPGGNPDFLRVILTAESKQRHLAEKAPHLLIKLVSKMAILGLATPTFASQILDPQFLNTVLSRVSPKIEKNVLQNLRLLDQALRIEMCDYDGPHVPTELLARSIKIRSEVIQPMDIVLQEFLEVGFGGQQFVLNGLWTKYGHYIDHLVVMRKGDFPIAINSSPTKCLESPQSDDGLCYVENIIVPPDSKMLAVLIARQEWFTKDPPMLSCSMAFQQRTLKKLGYNPIILGPPIKTEGQSQDLVGNMENELF